jgi:polyphosphate glucokinase
MPATGEKKQILVVDIGGTNVKVLRSVNDQRKFSSGEKMRPEDFVTKFKEATKDWEYDAVSIGFPSPVQRGQVSRDPKHLGPGWVGFDFSKPLGAPVQMINDAAMQALGSYGGSGRMLFLGLGTGLGSALVWEGTIMPLELGDLPYRDRDIIENFLGICGIDRLGEEEWKREVLFAITQLKKSFVCDRVVIGGGNVNRFKELPPGFDRGQNENAFEGGLRLWETMPGSAEHKWQAI